MSVCILILAGTQGVPGKLPGQRAAHPLFNFVTRCYFSDDL